MTVFGRPLADMDKADADCLRGFLACLDWCEECKAYRKGVAELWFDVGARRIEIDRHGGVVTP